MTDQAIQRLVAAALKWGETPCSPAERGALEDELADACIAYREAEQAGKAS